MAHELGDIIEIPLTFRRTSTKAKVDPTAWQVRVRPPVDGDLEEETVVYGDADGAFTSLVRDDEGEYRIVVTTSRDDDDMAGRWVWWATSTGVGAGSKSGFFVVDEPALELPAP